MGRDPRCPRKEICYNGKSINVCRECESPTSHKPWCTYEKKNVEARKAFAMRSARTPTTVLENPTDAVALNTNNIGGTGVHNAGAENINNSANNNSVYFDEEDMDIESATTTPSILKSEWLQKIWQKRKASLPSMHKMERSLAAIRGSKVFDADAWSGGTFLLPDALNSAKPSLVEHLLSRVEVHVICPNTFFPIHAADFTLACTACGDKATKERTIIMNGWSNVFRICIHKRKFSLIMARRYLHNGCPAAATKGFNSTSFSSIHPKVVAQYSPLLRESLPFRILQKIIIHRDFITEIREARMSTSTSAIHKVHKALQETMFMRCIRSYLLSCKHFQSRWGKKSLEVDRLQQKDPSSLDSAEKLVQVIYTDNPKQDEAFAKEVFGANVTVKRDIAHAILDYKKGCRQNHPATKAFLNAVVNCFFEEEEDDKKIIIKHYVERGVYTEEEMQKFSPSFYAKRRRQYATESDTCKKRLENVFTAFRDKGCFFNDKMLKIHSNIIAHVNAKWYEDPPADVQMYYNVGTDDLPLYITARSTSQLENFHRVLRTPIDSCLSANMMHPVFMDLVYRWNISKAIKNRKVPLLAVYDPQLYNDVLSLYKKLNVPFTKMPRYISCWRQVLPLDTTSETEESFGVLRQQYGSSSHKATVSMMEEIAVRQSLEKEIDIETWGTDLDFCKFDQQEPTKKKDEWQQSLLKLTHVNTAEEKRLYRFLVTKFKKSATGSTNTFQYANHSSMSDEWNRLLTNSVIDCQSKIIATNGPIAEEFLASEIGLKNHYHLLHHAKLLDNELINATNFHSFEEKLRHTKMCRRRYVSKNEPLQELDSNIPLPIMAAGTSCSLEIVPAQTIPNIAVLNRETDSILKHTGTNAAVAPPTSKKRKRKSACASCGKKNHTVSTTCPIGSYLHFRQNIYNDGLDRTKGKYSFDSATAEWVALNQSQKDAWIHLSGNTLSNEAEKIHQKKVFVQQSISL